MKKIPLLYEDDDCLAIHKPAGLLSVPDRHDPAIINVKHLQQNEDPNRLMVHRLDKDTSGILLIAKTEKAQVHLSSQFEQQTIDKEYLAIVHGIPASSQGVIEAALVEHEHLKGRMIIHKKGKSALTNWFLEDSFKFHSLLRLKPTTGRTHQLRVHLAHIGHAILSDPKYGDGKALFLSSFKRKVNPNKYGQERPLISRTALHARKITFDNLQGEKIEIICELPKDMRASLNQLSKNL
ncbi:UNVERIFIED_CONTAM: hypothetical protein GTU68_040034 [Idotea baltica]|nr:hypothetical protein [Idotea baltica]